MGETVETWQISLQNRVTLALAVLGVGLSPIFLTEAPLPGVLSGLIALVALSAVRSLAYSARTYLLSLALSGISFFSAWSVGMGPGALLSGLLAICVAGIFQNVRAAVAFWLLTSLSLAFAFHLLSEGVFLVPIDLSRLDPRIAGVGRRFSATYFALSSVLALGVSAVVQRLSGALHQAQAALLSAEAANERARKEATAKEGALLQLVEAQKFEVLAQLSASVAHDFNNSLQVIMADASAIETSRTGNRPVSEIAREISEMCRDSALVARQLLTLGQRVVLEPCVTDLGKEVALALRAAERLLPPSTLVETDLPLGHFTRIDRVQLKQAILNLAINAGHAMPNGGTLRVELRQEGPDAEVLVVSDTGCGMDRETTTKIFDPFFTTKGAQGTGLGLAAVSAIMLQSGGRVDVESQQEHGTRFTLTFPAASAGETESSSSTLPPLGLPDVRVLVVDDDRRVLGAMQSMLSGFGADVVTVTSAESALGELCKSAQPFRLLCTDAVMPGLPTRELIAHVRRDFPNVAILLCSAYVESDLLRRGIETREVAFLAKPFSAEQLARKLQGLLVPASEKRDRAPG